MIKTVIGIVGINVDDNYRWKERLFIDDDVATSNQEMYSDCKSYIKIKYNINIDFSKARKIEENIYGCDEYIYDSKKGAKIYFEDENNCVIETNQEVNEWLVIMLQIMLLKNGYSFIHAAAVSKNEEALLMPSWGGVGKTASVAKLVKKDYKILGDDLNIIKSNGEVYPFPKKFVLYFYHKELFPEVFKKQSPKSNAVLNKFYSAIIPSVKRILRFFPSVLSFMRKHNPQSIKVSPIEIFGKDVISEKSKIKQVMWIERVKGENNFLNIDVNDLASKAVAVTVNEIFNENTEAVLIMCGFLLTKYEDIFVNMYNIYLNAFNNTITNKLNVSENVHVSVVADEVIKNIKFGGN